MDYYDINLTLLVLGVVMAVCVAIIIVSDIIWHIIGKKGERK